MINLPSSKKLPIEYLAACFNDVTNSYKFYWFLSILEHVKASSSSTIPIKSLLANMVADVWFPSNYFYLSFGKQDRLSQVALKIRETSNLKIDSKKGDIVNETFSQLQTNSTLANEILTLGRFVPYRFLRPFFSKELSGVSDWRVDNFIKKLAENSFYEKRHLCPYRFVSIPEESIEIQKEWFEYLQEHLYILTGFCFWHLLNYLQKNNPNVPNIAGKLFEPIERDLRQARVFWQLAFDHLGSIRCIYSDQTMRKDAFSLDHFLPWRFVTHDLLWNIVPTPKNINSMKNDNLPDVDKYFDRFAQLQYEAFVVALNLRKTKLIEDYILLFRNYNFGEATIYPFEQFRQTLQDTILPQIQIAKNMGFASDWSYTTL